MLLLPRLPVASDWAKASSVAGNIVTVGMSGSVNGRKEAILPSRQEHMHFDVSPPRLRPSRVFWQVNSTLRGRSLVRLVDQLRARGRPVILAHGHFFSQSDGLPYLAAHRRIPYVVSEHSSALTRFNPEKEIGEPGLKLARLVFERAAAVLPVSRYLEDEIRRRGLPGRFTVVPNPVDTHLFRPSAPPTSSRVITVSRLVKVKRLDLLLRAVAAIAKVDPDIRLAIVGNGPEYQPLRSLAHNLSIADRVVFHGRVDRAEIPHLLSESSVFAMSSHTENLPVAMLEALACGLPVVGPRVGGIPEIITGAPGEIFQPGNVESLATALSRWLHASPSARGAARQVAMSRYSVSAVGAKLADVYRAAVMSGPSSAIR